MKILKVAITLMFIAGTFSCDKESHEPTRSFYMGFTPFPFAISMEAVNYTYSKISTDSDIINHHFDNGVPWKEALLDTAFHPNIMSDWTFRKQNTPVGHKVYLSVSALTIERNGMAKYRAESEDMPLPDSWNSYRFNDEKVKAAYLNYCKRIIGFFNPDFFNMNVEGNLLYFVNPALWTDFIEFHRFIYQELKIAFPSLPIFCSVTGAQMLPGYFPDSDHVQQRLAALQLLEHSDLYAISFYPYISAYLGNPYPENSIEDLFSLSDKPLAIAETAYPAQTFTINMGGTDLTISADATKQNNYLNDLLKACEKRKAKFVINFVLRDYDALWASAGAKNDLSVAWRDTGLIDENGNERKAYVTWKNHFKHALKP
jgi:hypothetical protein